VPTLKAALFLGFGLTGGIWLFAGFYFTSGMAELERRSTAINARYMRAQDLLAATRGHVLMGSVYVRDALLDPEPATAAEYRRQLEESYRAADRALQEYVPVLDVPEERERIARLRHDIEEFRRTLLDVLNTDSRLWRTEAHTLLRRRIMPKRDGVMRVSEEVQALNRSAFVQQQADISALYALTQRRLWWTIGAALIASIGIALVATLYAGRLERRLHLQRLKDIENTRDLQRLSSQLLTAQEEERRSIARELHDEIGQVLTAIKVELSLAQQAIEAAGGPAGILQDARTITDGALNAARDLSHLLHPALLDDLGLPAAIEWYLKGFAKRHGVRAELQHERMDARLSPHVEAAVYRIVQEALTNIARHAHATRCRVHLQRLAGSVLVTIEDNGVGFDQRRLKESSDSHGLGLVGIRERASELSGTLRIDSAPGEGTRLTVELPIDKRQSASEASEERDTGAMMPREAREVLGG
jgi:signal transduction histidine kinase